MKMMTTPKERRKKERNKYEISSVLWNFVGERDESYFSLFVICMSLFGRQPKVVILSYPQEILG